MTFLLDALKTFQLEGWRDLELATLKDVANCYRKLGSEKEKLARVCAQVACFKTAAAASGDKEHHSGEEEEEEEQEEEKERKEYFNEMMEVLKNVGKSTHILVYK